MSHPKKCALRIEQMALFVIVAIYCIAANANAQLRIVTYNCADPSRSGVPTLLQALGDQSRGGFAKPIDLLFLQEQGSLTNDTQGFVNALNTLYGAGTYARGFLDGDGNGTQAVVYRSGSVQLIAETQASSTNASGAASSALRYRFRPVGYDTNADFYVYNTHLKSSDTTSDRARRAVEVTEIRADADALGEGAHIIYLGDFNLYRSSEQAFVNYTNTGNGQAFDPVNRIGTWNNNTNFIDVHTQSPVAISHTYYGGQIGGGLDDRFDFQLVTGEVLDGRGFAYITNSYWAFGNTATHSLNNSLSGGSVTALQAFLPGYTTDQVSTVITSVMSSSDHLPVVADYQLPAKMGVALKTLASRAIVGTQLSGAFAVSNNAPASFTNGADRLEYTFSASGDMSGSGGGTNIATLAANLHSFTVDTSSVGAKSGSLSVTASSPQTANASYNSALAVDVLHAATASFASDAATTLLEIDFGSINFGDSAASRLAAIHNLAGLSGSAWTARLDLDSVASSVPAGIFTTTLSPFANLAAESSSGFTLSMGSSALGSFSGTYTLGLSDENITGATNYTMTIAVRGSVAGNLAVGAGQTRIETNAITGNGALTKSAAGTLTLVGTNTYTGNTFVTGGRLALAAGTSIGNTPVINVSSDAVFDVSALSDGFVLEASQKLSGTGTVEGDVTVSGTVSPGNSPGTLTINGDLTWSAGGSYDWEIYDVDDGAGTGWDLIDVVGGSLLFSGLSSGTPFVINIYSLSGLPSTGGMLAAFNNTANYSWTILQSDALITGFNAANFSLNTTAFTAYNPLDGGIFSLEASGNDLRLLYTGNVAAAVPEPGTWAAAALLLVAGGWTGYLRRKKKTSVSLSAP